MVTISAIALFGIWLAFNFPFIISTQNGVIRFFLTSFMALLIFLRQKPEDIEHKQASRGPVILLLTGIAALGTLVAVTGIIFRVRQFQWLGLLMIMFSCFKWALPRRFSRDIILGLFLLYWSHPLPNQLFILLQLGMQNMSVQGAEWLLHLVNARVWADGFVLRTGVNIYEVPAWCSGMRTATTMLLVTLGLGILKRLKWYECGLFIIVALIQALMLNILRISAMVLYAPRTETIAGARFLHDSTGIIVIAGVFIVYLELLLWQNIQRKRQAYKQELFPQKVRILTAYPPVLQAAYRHKSLILLIFVTVVLVSAALFKSRSSHRVEMLKTVVEELRDIGDLENAERLAELVYKKIPADETWRLVVIRILILRGKYEQALTMLNDFSVLSDPYDISTMEKTILRAYTLLWLGRLNEAAAIVGAMPEHVRNQDARVAMVLAEMAFYSGNPDKVAQYVATAAQYRPNINRVRALYPYLRTYRKWDAIADSDPQTSYTSPAQAFSALEAYMNLNDTPTVAEMTRNAIKAWPDDPRILEPLFFMAQKQLDGQWQDRFASRLVHCIQIMDNPDELYKLFNKCFQLARPDLAWLVYHRISDIDPSHPTLSMSAVHYGDNWFIFRKGQLSIKSLFSDETISIKPFFIFGRILPAWRPFCDRVPLGLELSAEPNIAFREEALQSALREFQKRDEEGNLSLPMRYEYVQALEMTGNMAKARDQLSYISSKHPEEQERTIVFLSGIYEHQNDWQSVYELLREYMESKKTPESPPPLLTPVLRLYRAQSNLRLGLGAINTAREAVRLFPYFNTVIGALADALMQFDSPEEALHALATRDKARESSVNRIEARALYMSERYFEANNFCRSALIPLIPIPADASQLTVLPPAEVSVLWHAISIPSEKQFDDNAVTLKANIENTISPFLRDMMKLWLECYERGDLSSTEHDADPYSIQRWLKCGRDNTEKAIALNQLTLLLCRNREFVKARNAAGNAVKLLPESPILWRILISLSNGDLDVINVARHWCPEDGEIWLAELVVKSQAGIQQTNNPSALWNCDVTPETANRFSPAVVTRAADYLLRGGFESEAIVLARSVMSRARGLLPTYVLCIKCALAENNRQWALESTKTAISASLRPPPTLYKQLLTLRDFAQIQDMDADTVNALRMLNESEPDNPLWDQMLGYTRFKRGGWEVVESIYRMIDALENGATNKTPFIVAAEASRRFGNTERAAEILRRGLKHHPNDLAMMNNLAYTLADVPARAQEALEFIPSLLADGYNNPHILDTIAVVYMRCGKLDEAEKTLSVSLEKAEQHSQFWFRAKTHQSRIALMRGNVEAAESVLIETIGYSRGVPEEYLLEANQLFAEIETEKLLRMEKPERANEEK